MLKTIPLSLNLCSDLLLQQKRRLEKVESKMKQLVLIYIFNVCSNKTHSSKKVQNKAICHANDLCQNLFIKQILKTP